MPEMGRCLVPPTEAERTDRDACQTFCHAQPLELLTQVFISMTPQGHGKEDEKVDLIATRK
jgi:hypothetical protein